MSEPLIHKLWLVWIFYREDPKEGFYFIEYVGFQITLKSYEQDDQCLPILYPLCTGRQ